MEALIIYSLKVSIAILLFYGLYFALLRNETFFKIRRAYFLLVLLFSLLYPIIEFEIKTTVIANITIATYTLPEIDIFANGQSTQEAGEVAGSIISLWAIILLASLMGTIVLLARFLMQLSSLFYNLVNRKWEKADNCKLTYLSDNSFSSFSFFRWIIINTAGRADRQIQDIIRHERVHASQLHSIDVLLYELFCILFWWNPVAWLMKNEMKLNLEYLADEGVIKQDSDFREYQYTLLQVNMANTGIAFINNFNVSHLKKRISMMNKKRSPILRLSKFLLIVPLTIALIIGNIACTPSEKKKEQTETTNKETVATPQDQASEPVPQSVVPSDNTEQQKVYDFVEEQPRYPGGEDEMMKWIKAEIKYPESAQEAGIQGRVMVRFVVGADGNIGDVQVMRGVDPACDKEAVRVVKAMPKWEPGKQNGEAVAVYYNLPVLFRLK